MIVLVAGVSGSGKTTVGTMLAARLGWPFADGDSFHPAANIAKMRAGQPLTDADRWPWLAVIGAWIDERIAAGQSAVLACSALRRRYRAALLAGQAARMVFLQLSREQAAARLRARHGHFFPAKLLDSQFAVLEEPREERQDLKRMIVVPALGEPADVVADAMTRLGLTADHRPA